MEVEVASAWLCIVECGQREVPRTNVLSKLVDAQGTGTVEIAGIGNSHKTAGA